MLHLKQKYRIIVVGLEKVIWHEERCGILLGSASETEDYQNCFNKLLNIIIL